MQFRSPAATPDPMLEKFQPFFTANGFEMELAGMQQAQEEEEEPSDVIPPLPRVEIEYLERRRTMLR